jgi:hypothetical protein
MSPQSNFFLESIITFLLPYFSIHAADLRGARSEILDTLASYATRTRAEMLQAAQIIALGMTTLDVLAEAKTAEMSQSMRIRYRGCANGLNRSTLNTEKALDRRLDCELPAATPEPVPEPVNDVPDADMQVAMEQARAAIEAHRNSLPSRRPASDAPKPPSRRRARRRGRNRTSSFGPAPWWMRSNRSACPMTKPARLTRLSKLVDRWRIPWISPLQGRLIRRATAV